MKTETIKNTWVKVDSWSNVALYKASNGIKSANVEITTTKDRLGSLKRVECGKMGMFEEYSMTVIKEKIFNYLNK